jgi:hypothetical protein
MRIKTGSAHRNALGRLLQKNRESFTCLFQHLNRYMIENNKNYTCSYILRGTLDLDSKYMMHLILTIIIISCTTWCLCQSSPLFSLWETTCKVHADTKHEEMKGIVKDHSRFNADNWSHSVLLVLTAMISRILLVGCYFVCYRFGPIIMLAKKLRNINQLIPHNHNHQPFNSSFNAPPYTGRTLQFREILPDQQTSNIN